MSRVAEQIPTALAGELPSGWSLATIPDLVGADGVFVDGDWVESKDQDPNGAVRLIQLADIGDGGYRNKSDRFLTHEKALELGCTFLMRDDVLIARMPDPLGRACIFPGVPKKSVTVVDVAIVRSGNGEFNHRWLMYFINAPIFRTTVASLQSGSTRKRISRGNLARIALPVPPREQQIRIVAEIEKQFSRLDEAVANLKRVKANLKRYKAALLKAAVEGKLTEDWRKAHPDVEPATKLLERILTTRRAKWSGKGKYKEPGSPNLSHPPKLPGLWVWASAFQACEAVVDCHNKTAPYTNSGIPLVRTSNIREGKLLLGNVRYVNQPTYAFWSRRCPPEPGDVLFTREAPMGEAGIIPPGARICMGQRIMLMRPSDAISGRFLLYAIMSPVIKQMIDRTAVGSGVKHLRVGDVELLPIPVPPKTEQEWIVCEVDRRLSVIDELETIVEANLNRGNRLRQSVLRCAFSGKLLPSHFLSAS